jgi:plasmid rolling circle replication initiator protein Rep
MQPWDEYRRVKIERGELVDQIKNKKQQDWIKVCKKLGIIVRVDYGRGDHAVVNKDNCPPEDRRCCITTLTRNMHSGIQRDIFKKILAHGLETGKFKEDDIWEALGVKL